MSRVEDLEARVAELSAELDGLLDEYMDTRRRLHELEASHGSDAPESDPYGLGDDPHAVVIDRRRDRADAARGSATSGQRASTGTDPGPDAGTTAVTPYDDTTNEASQEEVDEAVRRVEDSGGSDAAGGTTESDRDDGDDARTEAHEDDIIVG